MALMMDALGTPDGTPIILESKPAPPRFTAERINNHGYNKTTRRLEFSVSWVGSSEADTLESYHNLGHLHILTEYEIRMHDLNHGSGEDNVKCTRQRQRHNLRKYILQRDREAAAMLSEDDTDSNVSELKEERQLALEGSPLLMEALIAPSMDSPLATSEDWLQQLATGSLSKEVPQWPMGEVQPRCCWNHATETRQLGIHFPLVE
jgi:hypothetical protein